MQNAVKYWSEKNEDFSKLQEISRYHKSPKKKKYLKLTNRFEVLQYILEEEQDVNVVNKKLTSSLQEIAKEKFGEAQVKKTVKITEERTRESMKKRK